MSVAKVYPPFKMHPAPFPTDGRYRAECYHVADGDTLDVLVDLGFGHQATERLRFRGFDAPEILLAKHPAEHQLGLRCKERVMELALEKPVLLRTFKTTGQETQTLGRYVADLWVYHKGSWVSCIELLTFEKLGKADVPLI